MSKQRPRRRSTPHHRPPRRSPHAPAATPIDVAGEPDLISGVRRAMRAGHPDELLAHVSAILEALSPKRALPFDTPPDADTAANTLDLAGFATALIGADISETTALLTGISAMADDDLLRARIARELARRRSHLPDWLDDLDGVQVYRAVEMVHVLGDGDDVMLGARFTTGQEITATVYIDHNMGTLVKDAFVLPEPIGTVVELMRRKVEDPDTSWNDIPPADAKARITQAIELGEITYPPCESDTWPACRPLVRWLTRLLPDGGTGYEKPEWEDAELTAIAGRFFASRFGEPYDDVDHRRLLDSLLWFGSGYGPGDPLRWSNVSVEILLVDWIPRKIVADVDFLAKAPDLLRAFVRFCHHERGIRTSLTTEALDAVDHFEPEYQALIRSPRRQGTEALNAAMMGGSYSDNEDEPDIEMDLSDLDRHIADLVLGTLRDRVGGEQALRDLDEAPLPDEEFDWDGVPADVRPRVEAVLPLVDGCCDKLFDTEFRTACRRFLATVARTGPDALRRQARADHTAVAVCWTLGRANSRFGNAPGDLRVKDLTAHFGVTGTPSQRATKLLRAGGFPDQVASHVVLGSPRYLDSGCRQATIDARDYLSARGF